MYAFKPSFIEDDGIWKKWRNEGEKARITDHLFYNYLGGFLQIKIIFFFNATATATATNGATTATNSKA
jgi:hypothetical protein